LGEEPLELADRSHDRFGNHDVAMLDVSRPVFKTEARAPGVSSAGRRRP
jgi:hypothetical protein